MSQAQLLPRKTKILFWLGLLAFVALLLAGPWREATAPERHFSSAWLLSSLVFVTLLTRRVGFALALTSLIFGGLLIASVVKFAYLTTPLLAPDLVYFVNRDLVEVLLRYPALLALFVGGFILIPALLILAWRSDRPIFLQRFSRNTRSLIRAGGSILGLLLILICASPDGPFADIYGKGMWQTMNDKSYLTDFFISFNQTKIQIPVSPVGVDRSIVWNDPPKPAELHPADAVNAITHYPDIVTILEESTFDPRMLQVCGMPLCKFNMFVPDARTRASGSLVVHTWGGGTWTSEFAALTGLSHTSFGNAGLYAPYNLAPRVTYTLPRALKAAGYKTIAVYPMSGDFINARNAYRYYGFDEFIEGSTYGLAWESSDTDLMQVFDQIYTREKKEAGKQPLFVFMLTLRQHGPHMTPLKFLKPPYNAPLFPMLDKWLNLNLGNYLSRLESSDSALAQQEKFLLDSDRQTVLLHFGDHQPSFDGAINAIKKLNAPKGASDPMFVTYYMLKSNFAPKEKYSYPVLDLSFLAGLVLDVAGVPKDEFFEANTRLRERCKGFYLDCADKRMLDSYTDFIFHTLQALHD